jgi:putative membrane protein
MIVDGMREKQAAQAICKAVEHVGDLLAEHFPIRPDDQDELSNFIVES